MNTFFEINTKGRIGYKKITKSELGRGTSHLTHIGLFEDTLEFLTDYHRTASSKLIYNNTTKELICLINFITKPDGTHRSPKIRKGESSELHIGDIKTNSIVGEILEIVEKFDSNTDWYILWFGLTNEELVFYLFKDGSNDLNELKKLVPGFGLRGRISQDDAYFNNVIKFLEKQTEKSSISILQELEIIAQTDEVPVKIIKPRFFDIQRAKEKFAITGKKGEELIAQLLDYQKSEKLIYDFKWLNSSRESGMPYDFEIIQSDKNKIFTDVKTTSYKFEQGMIFSKNELGFISQNSNYHIYRVYGLDDPQASLKICENINLVSTKLISSITNFEKELQPNQTKLHSVKLSISPNNELIKFNDRIILQ
jgi:hypothetical protein